MCCEKLVIQREKIERKTNSSFSSSFSGFSSPFAMPIHYLIMPHQMYALLLMQQLC